MSVGTPEPETARRFALYARKTARSKGRLVTIMFDEHAADLHADALCAAMGYASVEARSLRPGEDAPDSVT